MQRTILSRPPQDRLPLECIKEDDNTFRPKRPARPRNRLIPMVRLPRKKHYAGRSNAYLSYLDDYYADLAYEDDLRSEAVGIYY